jgi:hypothetical protein
MATVYINREENDHVRFENDTGADLAQYEATVVGPYAAVADEAIKDGEVGSFHVEEGIQCQISDLVYGEDAFDTVGQPVYFDPDTGDFSDTEDAGYYLWGYLVLAKDAHGMIVVEKRRYAVLVTT